MAIIMLEAFNCSLYLWLLHPLERPKHDHVSFLVFICFFFNLKYIIYIIGREQNVVHITDFNETYGNLIVNN